MTIGRPRSEDSPHKYQDAIRLYSLSGKPQAQPMSAIEELAGVLEWAITNAEPGFRVGDILNVTGLAQGVDKSRNTAGKAVETLVQKGMLVQNKPKSPYVIVSRTPIFSDTGVVADEQISLTLKFESSSLISEVASCELPGGELAAFLTRELAGSGDPLVCEAARDYWTSGVFQHYLRLRTAEIDGTPTGVLLESTFLHLAPEAAERFRAAVGCLREQRISHISLYPLLEESGLSDFRAGRSHVTVSPTPAPLLRELNRTVATAGIDMGAFSDQRPLLKWTYGIFHPEVHPMITFSVCYVHADLLSIFIRNLDVELGQPV